MQAGRLSRSIVGVDRACLHDSIHLSVSPSVHLSVVPLLRHTPGLVQRLREDLWGEHAAPLSPSPGWGEGRPGWSQHLGASAGPAVQGPAARPVWPVLACAARSGYCWESMWPDNLSPVGVPPSPPPRGHPPGNSQEGGCCLWPGEGLVLRARPRLRLGRGQNLSLAGAVHPHGGRQAIPGMCPRPLPQPAFPHPGAKQSGRGVGVRRRHPDFS